LACCAPAAPQKARSAVKIAAWSLSIMIIPPFAPKEALSRRRGQLGNGVARVDEARLQPLRCGPRRGTQDLAKPVEGFSKPLEGKSKS
jgi:hypothetical protein